MAFIDQDMSNFIPEIWSKKVQKKYDNICVMEKLVNTDYEGDIKQGGDTVHSQLIGDFTTQDYVRNAPKTLQQMTVTDDTLVINQQKYVYGGVDDLDERQSFVNIQDQLADRAAVAMRNTVDTRLLSHYADAPAANTLGSLATPRVISPASIYDQFIEAGERLDVQNINPEAERHIVIPAEMRTVMLKSPELRDRSTDMVDETIMDGYVGKFGRFNVHVTTNMTKVSGVWPILFFTRDYISFAKQLTKSYVEKPSGYEIKAITTLYLYGSKVFSGQARAGGTIYATV